MCFKIVIPELKENKIVNENEMKENFSSIQIFDGMNNNLLFDDETEESIIENINDEEDDGNIENINDEENEKNIKNYKEKFENINNQENKEENSFEKEENINNQENKEEKISFEKEEEEEEWETIESFKDLNNVKH
jgi:hypothetical protein